MNIYTMCFYIYNPSVFFCTYKVTVYCTAVICDVLRPWKVLKKLFLNLWWSIVVISKISRNFFLLSLLKITLFNYRKKRLSIKIKIFASFAFKLVTFYFNVRKPDLNKLSLLNGDIPCTVSFFWIRTWVIWAVKESASLINKITTTSKPGSWSCGNTKILKISMNALFLSKNNHLKNTS